MAAKQGCSTAVKTAVATRRLYPSLSLFRKGNGEGWGEGMRYENPQTNKS